MTSGDESRARLRIVPVTRDEARAFVAEHHRHLPRFLGAIFHVGVACEGAESVCGVAVVGRPVSRMLDDGWTLEVVRCCTDGTPNAASALYRAAWRVARELGYRRLVTYTLEHESGASLRGAGFARVIGTRAQQWHRETRPRVDTAPAQHKIRWELHGNP